ncbi:glycosyltransferase [Photorhabdus heterorhabditis]|uniref:glycosyltransferase n=1 Tax=Photorhabdus heterorhabditis TaxID=880156 RepID=UPI0015622681|nr:glycosyltransferase [Photorhabdus heterorhabditis]NRN30169.1 glycosyltransferase [Photorhabdus heterorhabditis subsp. aluminescens]
MKLLHLINLQGFGGAERIFIQYLKHSNNENIVICTSNDINSNIAPEIDGAKIIYANRVFNGLKIKYPTLLRKLILKLKIEKTKADLIIVWDFIPKISKKPKKCKIIYYDHGCSWRYPMDSRTLNFFSMIDGCIAASKASDRVMSLRFKLNCPVNIVINRLEKQHISTTNIIKNLDSPVILGTASRLVSSKGISVSILMLHELIKRGHSVMLHIAGDGKFKKELKRLVNDLQLNNHVVFLGYQSDMNSFFNKIDIYLSTSVNESFGLSCIEALSYNVPVIFPIVDGQPEAVKDGFCGIGLIPQVSLREHKALTDIDIDFPHKVYDPINDSLVEPKLVSHIDGANAVESLINNSSFYSQLSKNAQQYSKMSFDYHKFKDEFEEVLLKYVKK